MPACICLNSFRSMQYKYTYILTNSVWSIDQWHHKSPLSSSSRLRSQCDSYWVLFICFRTLLLLLEHEMLVLLSFSFHRQQNSYDLFFLLLLCSKVIRLGTLVSTGSTNCYKYSSVYWMSRSIDIFSQFANACFSFTLVSDSDLKRMAHGA